METFYDATPDNLGEWIAAIATALSCIAALFARKRKGTKREG
jgi:hypothetical protein